MHILSQIKNSKNIRAIFKIIQQYIKKIEQIKYNWESFSVNFTQVTFKENNSATKYIPNKREQINFFFINFI